MGSPLEDGGARENVDRPPKDRLFRLLSAKRRRYVIVYLREATAPLAVADLARRIAEREPEQTPAAASNHREAVYRSLYHCHVPKLADARVVEHNRNRDTVEPGPNFTCATALLDALSEVDGSTEE